MAVSNFFQQFFQNGWQNLEWPNMANLNFFQQLFPKKTGTNLEWPKMAIPNFFQQFFPKRLAQIQNGQKWLFLFFSDNCSPKEWL